MNRQLRVCLAWLWACALPAALAGEMQVTVWPPEPGSTAMNPATTWVQLDGDIDAGAPERLRQQLQLQNRQGTVLAFAIHSPGGNLGAAMELGRMIRQEGGHTHIGVYQGEGQGLRPGRCMSACALTFLGGTFRFVNVPGSRFGVHRFYRASSEPNPRDLEVAQIVTARINTYIRAMGASPALLDLMARTPSETLYVLTPLELEVLQVVNNGRMAPRWSIEAAPAGLYLRAEQRSSSGLGRILFFCASGRALLRSLVAVPDEQGPAMARGEWTATLRVDGQESVLTALKLEHIQGFLDGIYALQPAQVKLLMEARNRVGQALRPEPDQPLFVGHEIDLPADQRQKLVSYLGGCVSK